jgi:signal recognition particle subunit SRP54
MFETITDRLTSSMRTLSGRGRISESNIREVMDDVRTALLDAEVNLEVVTTFCDDVIADAIGAEITKSLNPDQEMIGIVHRQLVELMGPEEHALRLVDPGPTIIMMCGLQGSGKTTTCGKLAAWLKKPGHNTLLVAADLQRPAAVAQLQVTAETVEAEAPGNAKVDFYGEPEKCGEYGEAVGVALGVCQRGIAYAKAQRFNVVILDTAGRLHIDDELMGELAGINTICRPHQVLLLVDAMVGQDAVNSAKVFHDRLAIDGVILAKMDSDTRGGAALSVRAVTGAPIMFTGVSERFDGLEEFHGQRMAGRILGMGDVVSLVEKAQEEVDEEEAERLAQKMAKGEFFLVDFVKQLKSIRRMGPMKQVLGMLPGVGSMLKNTEVDEEQFDRIEAIVNSMTTHEREEATSITKSRVRRIARGSGTSSTDVNKVLKQFQSLKQVTKEMAGMGARGRAGAMREMSAAMQGGAGGPGGMALPGRGGNTKTKSPKKGFKRRKKK